MIALEKKRERECSLSGDCQSDYSEIQWGSLGRGRGRADPSIARASSFLTSATSDPLLLKRHKSECQDKLRPQVGCCRTVTRLR